MRGLLLAAGEGKRLRPFTDDRPKPCVLVANVPLLAYGFAFLRSVGVHQYGVVSGYKHDCLVEMVAVIEPSAVIVQNTKIGSQNAASLLCALETFSEDLLVCDADYIRSSSLANAVASSPTDSVALFIRRVSGVVEDQMRVQINEHNHVTALSKTLPTYQAVSTGIMLIPAIKRERVLALTRETIERLGVASARVEDVLMACVNDGSVVRAVDVGDTPWFEIDTPEDLAAAEDALREHPDLYLRPANV